MSPYITRLILFFGFVIVVQCQDCGIVTPSIQLILNGVQPKRGEVPWDAAVYMKTKTPYQQICRGSIVKNNVILSSGHCFWSNIEKQLPTDQFAVAVGKIYRQWDNAADAEEKEQKFDVKEIHLPLTFQGCATNFQSDIAVVILTSPIQYTSYVRPVCLNFDINLDKMQLQANKLGKVASWSLGDTYTSRPVLRVLDISYLETDACSAQAPADFREYISSDKICASTKPNCTGLCRGDGGSGLAFPAVESGTERFYLRGIASVAPYTHDCNASTLTTFTHVIKHKDFITPFLTDS